MTISQCIPLGPNTPRNESNRSTPPLTRLLGSNTNNGNLRAITPITPPANRLPSNITRDCTTNAVKHLACVSINDINICQVCLTSSGRQLNIQLPNCAHQIHATCLGEMVKHAMRDKASADIELKCPTCRTTIQQEKLPSLIEFKNALKDLDTLRQNFSLYKGYITQLMTEVNERTSNGRKKHVMHRSGLIKDSFWNSRKDISDFTDFLFRSRVCVTKLIDTITALEEEADTLELIESSMTDIQPLLNALLGLQTLINKASRYDVDRDSNDQTIGVINSADRSQVHLSDLQNLDRNMERCLNDLPIEQLFVLLNELDGKVQLNSGSTSNFQTKEYESNITTNLLPFSHGSFHHNTNEFSPDEQFYLRACLNAGRNLFNPPVVPNLENRLLFLRQNTLSQGLLPQDIVIGIINNLHTPVSIITHLQNTTRDTIIQRAIASLERSDLPFHQYLDNLLSQQKTSSYSLSTAAENKVLQHYANNNHLNRKAQHRLMKTFNDLTPFSISMRLSLAGNSGLYDEVQALLSQDPAESVRLVLAENSHVNKSIIQRLKSDPNPTVKLNLLNNITLSEQDFIDLINDPLLFYDDFTSPTTKRPCSTEVQQAIELLASKPTTPPSWLTLLCKHNLALEKLALNSKTPENSLRLLTTHPNRFVRSYALSNDNTPVDALKSAYENGSIEDLCALIENRSLPNDLLTELSRHNAPRIRRAIVSYARSEAHHIANACGQHSKRQSPVDTSILVLAALHSNTSATTLDWLLTRSQANNEHDLTAHVLSHPAIRARTLEKQWALLNENELNTCSDTIINKIVAIAGNSTTPRQTLLSIIDSLPNPPKKRIINALLKNKALPTTALSELFHRFSLPPEQFAQHSNTSDLLLMEIIDRNQQQIPLLHTAIHHPNRTPQLLGKVLDIAATMRLQISRTIESMNTPSRPHHLLDEIKSLLCDIAKDGYADDETLVDLYHMKDNKINQALATNRKLPKALFDVLKSNPSIQLRLINNPLATRYM